MWSCHYVLLHLGDIILHLLLLHDYPVVCFFLDLIETVLSVQPEENEISTEDENAIDIY
jgi:hypothetical protein